MKLVVDGLVEDGIHFDRDDVGGESTEDELVEILMGLVGYPDRLSLAASLTRSATGNRPQREASLRDRCCRETATAPFDECLSDDTFVRE